jgi:hypothetical protein
MNVSVSARRIISSTILAVAFARTFAAYRPLLNGSVGTADPS